MDFKADLHIHSYFSDGKMSPEEILYLAKSKNLSGLSITDHDSIEAYSAKLFDLAKSLKLKLVPGVEISSELSGETVHILGYNFDVNSFEFKNFLNEIQIKRKLRNTEIIKKLNENGIKITEEELDQLAHARNIAKTTVGRLHIAQLLFEKGYAASIQKAFDDYIEDDGPCYVRGFKFLPDRVIDEIHKAKGKAVLAHPNLVKSRPVIEKLLKCDFDGIEAYYGNLLANYEKKWIKLAEEHDLLITGGSDFHGDVKPYISLGCSWVDEDTFNKLVE